MATPATRPALTTEIVHGWPALRALYDDCDRILASMGSVVTGLDPTNGSPWIEALSRTLLRDAEVFAIVVRRDRTPVAIELFYRHVAGNAAVRREIRPLTEAHGGRCGPLVEDSDPELAAMLLGELRRLPHGWDVLVATIPQDSSTHADLARFQDAFGVSVRCIATYESPYIELAASWDEQAKALPKKMRWTIRKGESDLRALGDLSYEEHAEPASVPSLIDAITAIERKSWKEQSGTSMTAQAWQREFWATYCEMAGKAGRLSGHVLRLAGRPIAYILGSTDGATMVLDLKESFDLAYADCSPGHVLKRFAFQTVMDRGVRTWDFMGRCEPYKMRWTDKTYRRVTVAMFNRTIRGRLQYARALLGGKSEPHPPGTR